MGAYSSGFPSAGVDDTADSSDDIRNLQDEENDRPDIDEEDDDPLADPGADEPLIEGLTRDLETKLINIVIGLEQESFPVWRFLNRDFFEAESFWKDLQHGFYDAQADIWRVPSSRELAKVGESGQRFTFQTNIYRAFGGTIVSNLGQKLPTTRFLPGNFEREESVLAAEAASDFLPLLDRWNKLQLKNVRAAYLLFTHGIVGAYTRYLEDSEKFGWKEVPEIAYQQAMIQEEGYECFGCGGFFPGPQGMGAAGSPCPGCQRPLSEINYRAPQYGEMPVEIGTTLVPRGRQIVTLHGGLELRLPPWCDDPLDYPYAGLVNEVHVSSLKGTYGKRAKGLQGGWGAGPYDTWDRFARLALVEPTVSYYGTSNQNLVTFKRYWLRPSLYQMLASDDDIATMLEIAPDGIYIAFADTQKLLDARNERLDDVWEFCNAVEGPGAYKPAMGSSVISVQKRFNTIENFIMEWIEYAAAGPGTFFNANVINYKAMKSQRRAPGMFYPLRMAVGQPIGNVLLEGKPGQIAGEVFRYGNDLRSQGEFLSGAVPTVSGGTEQSLKPTTYLSDKESAMGRMFTAWLHLRHFWAQVNLKSIKGFSRWATYDEQYSVVGPDGEARGKIVRVADLRGDIDAYPDTNEQFPVLWQQMQSTFLELMQIAPNDPEVMAMTQDLENATFKKAMLGLQDLFVPGLDDRRKQKAEIALMLQQKPVVIGMQPGANVAQSPDGGDLGSGQGQVPPPQMQPSIPIDPFEDNHIVHEETVKKWAVSAEGRKMKLQNPLGYHNVILHGMMHEQYRMMLMAAAAQAQGVHNTLSGGSEGGEKDGKHGGLAGSGSKAGGREKSSPGGSPHPKKGSPNGAPGGPSSGSDNPSSPGGASPIAQTEGIKGKIQSQVSQGPS